MREKIKDVILLCRQICKPPGLVLYINEPKTVILNLIEKLSSNLAYEKLIIMQNQSLADHNGIVY